MTLVITSPARGLVSEEGESVQRVRASRSREAPAATGNAVVGEPRHANHTGKGTLCDKSRLHLTGAF